ncbi:MAG: hypothetical protein COV36_04390 [Alphaproteobacteria bacterium CG11_big_fil_rev_8_21_14_0_20_44_7]|nr:MAG: hypothetical protein COV36_04390 [Alphaproteobacteria bacterium CG11_big_fil_rev_8_21_14_0_20_44_7]
MAKKRDIPYKRKKTAKSGGASSTKKPKASAKSRSRTPSVKPQAKKPSLGWRIFRWCLKIFLTLFAIGFIIGFFVLSYFAYDLPDINQLYEDKLRPSITILDSRGDVVTTYGDVFTEYVAARDMPKSLIDAVIATEDRRFYSHFGVDVRGIARAMYVNLRAGKFVQGGSTITQQLAKIIFLKPEKNLKRKIQEALLAIWLERKFTKDQIMTMYLNRVYLGAGVYGVDAASRKYFNKPVRKINTYESAMLAGLLKAPSTYSPQNNAHAAEQRTKQVLVNMVNAEVITEDERQIILNKGTLVHKSTFRNNSRYFTDFVVDQIPEFIGKVPQSLVVTTTLNQGVQKLAEDAVTKNFIEHAEKYNFTQAALVAMKPNGAILAMIGGTDYAESQFNRSYQAKRQPGSLFKLFVYMAALEDGYTPNSLIEDAPIRIGKWSPKNYDGKYRGTVTLKDALTSSLNAATVALSEKIGRGKVLRIAERMGIKSALSNTPSIALGASEVSLLEMVTAFAHLANQGRAVIPYTIQEIRTTEGDILYQRQGEYDFQILGINATKMMNEMLVNVVNNGTARAARIGRDVAGKTGTSQDFRDAWFVGFTPQITAGVWVGNDDNTSMNKVTGGGIPARIWRDFMSAAMADMPATGIDTNPYPEIEGNPWKRETFWDRILDN